MRRFMFSVAVVGLLGFALSPLGSDAWAQRRPRPARTHKAKAKSRKVVKPKAEAPKQAEPPAPQQNAPATSAPAQAASETPPTRGPARIDFDDRLIQGQTNQSGSVYLYERKELKTRSMIHEREDFRSEILSTVYDQP